MDKQECHPPSIKTKFALRRLRLTSITWNTALKKLSISTSKLFLFASYFMLILLQCNRYRCDIFYNGIVAQENRKLYVFHMKILFMLFQIWDITNKFFFLGRYRDIFYDSLCIWTNKSKKQKLRIFISRICWIRLNVLKWINPEIYIKYISAWKLKQNVL